MKRLLWLHGLWLCGSAVLIARLLLLALAPLHGSARASAWSPAGKTRWELDKEHFHTTVVDDARGRICFRDGQRWSPVTRLVRGQVTSSRVAVAPELIGRIGQPDVWPSAAARVPEQGRGGLEQSMDAVLQGKRPGLDGQLMMADHSGLPAAPAHATYRLTAQRGADVVTTIDAARERRAEQLLRQFGVSHGSIVSITLPQNELAVLASADHNQSDALRALAPGSVFKLVTAAAALESHVYNAQAHFYCDGSVHWPHVRMRCWRAHGHLSLTEAIAQSCDTTFAMIGIQLGRQALMSAGAAFGLNGTGLIPFRGQSLLPNADSGVVYRHAGDDAGLLANTAIGQEDVRMTPLQGALMAATIARQGYYQEAQLLRSLRLPGGHVVRAPEAIPRQACRGFTAGVLATGMWQAVHNPAGTAYRLHQWPIAAKTGTAELPDGRVNAWLIGFRETSHQPTEAFAICVADEPSRRAHDTLFRIAQAWLPR